MKQKVIRRQCVAIGCKVLQSNFGVSGSTEATHCLTHKVKGMINLSVKHWVKGPLPSNFLGPGRIDILTHSECQSRKRCIAPDGCSSFPSFNILGSKIPTYCGRHKLADMVNVVKKTCVYEWCETQISNQKYNGYCVRCFAYTFPDKPVSRGYQTKERAVTCFLKDAFPTVTWTCDRRVTDGCSARRPDMLCDLGDQVLIVEIDEHQHASYSCENKRMMQLSTDVGHRPIVFIRFNPDDYVDADGLKHTSCFGIDKQGVTTVKKCKLLEWEQRLSTLRGTVGHWMRDRTPKTVEVVSLFFTAE